MCRSIRVLREGTVIATPEEIEAATLQFVRKVSGFQHPASHNQAAFARAVDEISRSTQRLLNDLHIGGQPTPRV